MRSRARAGAFAVAIFVLYAWFFPWLPGLRSPNELSRLYQARAIVEDHALAVNAQMARHGTVGDLSVKDGRYYPNKAPGMSFLGAGVYAAVRTVNRGPPSEAAAIFWLRLILCVLPGAIAAELLRQILARRFDPQLATAGATVFALGTIMWPYSVLFMSHGPTTAALIVCWWAIERRSWALGGLMAGLAVLLEYTSAMALPPLAWYAMSGIYLSPARGEGRGEGWSSKLLPALLGFLPPILLLAAYHQLAFGNPFHTGYRHLVNPTFTEYHSRGFMGVGAPTLKALVGSFFDPARGLFAWAPFLALGIPGLAPLARRDRALALLCAAEIALYVLFTATFNYEAWGWSVGPRHVTPACAFLLPPALAAAEWLRERRAGFVAAALALAGVAKLALTTAVCPYLPEELTNPVWQLVVPLARAGLRASSVLEVATASQLVFAAWPWAALLIAIAAAACATLAGVSRGVQSTAAATAVALALLLASAENDRRDGFEGTRAFMAGVFRTVPERLSH